MDAASPPSPSVQKWSRNIRIRSPDSEVPLKHTLHKLRQVTKPTTRGQSRHFGFTLWEAVSLYIQSMVRPHWENEAYAARYREGVSQCGARVCVVYLCRWQFHLLISALVLWHRRRANAAGDRPEPDRQWQSKHFPCPSVAGSPSANCCFFPLVAPIRMIDEKRCRGDG